MAITPGYIGPYSEYPMEENLYQYLIQRLDLFLQHQKGDLLTALCAPSLAELTEFQMKNHPASIHIT